MVIKNSFTLLSGWNYAPRYSFRSNCLDLAVLHAQIAIKNYL